MGNVPSDQANSGAGATSRSKPGHRALPSSNQASSQQLYATQVYHQHGIVIRDLDTPVPKLPHVHAWMSELGIEALQRNEPDPVSAPAVPAASAASSRRGTPRRARTARHRKVQAEEAAPPPSPVMAHLRRQHQSSPARATSPTPATRPPVKSGKAAAAKALDAMASLSAVAPGQPSRSPDSGSPAQASPPESVSEPSAERKPTLDELQGPAFGSFGTPVLRGASQLISHHVKSPEQLTAERRWALAQDPLVQRANDVLAQYGVAAARYLGDAVERYAEVDRQAECKAQADAAADRAWQASHVTPAELALDRFAPVAAPPRPVSPARPGTSLEALAALHSSSPSQPEMPSELHASAPVRAAPVMDVSPLSRAAAALGQARAVQAGWAQSHRSKASYAGSLSHHSLPSHPDAGPMPPAMPAPVVQQAPAHDMPVLASPPDSPELGAVVQPPAGAVLFSSQRSTTSPAKRQVPAPIASLGSAQDFDMQSLPQRDITTCSPMPTELAAVPPPNAPPAPVPTSAPAPAPMLRVTLTLDEDVVRTSACADLYVELSASIGQRPAQIMVDTRASRIRSFQDMIVLPDSQASLARFVPAEHELVMWVGTAPAAGPQSTSGLAHSPGQPGPGSSEQGPAVAAMAALAVSAGSVSAPPPPPGVAAQ